MKFTFDGIQQEALVFYKLRPEDAIIIRYLVDLFASDKASKVYKGRHTFYYVDTAKMDTQMPAFHWKQETWQKRLRHYIRQKILEKTERHLQLKKQDHKFNRILYYRFTENAYKRLLTHISITA